MSRRLLRKKFTYRDRTGRSQEWHANHWRNFQWQAGPVIVAVSGPWGTMQVWASSESEGRRVLEHAAAAGGWVLRGEGVTWYVCRSSSGRNGREGLMATKGTPLGIEVSKRPGPSGFPSLG
jgi:hypothetical protein